MTGMTFPSVSTRVCHEIVTLSRQATFPSKQLAWVQEITDCRADEPCMGAKHDQFRPSSLQLGSNSKIPATPEEADFWEARLAFPIRRPIRSISGALYPEFTSLCPVTGQPDFAHLVIDYAPKGLAGQIQGRSSSTSPASAIAMAFHEDVHRWPLAAALPTSWNRTGCASAAM